ncbi:cytochrome P450, partial [Actinosynnema sp. NPDC023658]|uniref:cytochrome P450 n=1 Tax=Actinosynnema sp. NPDC023658 TaxID=3155465 RepID=UPI00340E66D3
MAVRRAAHPFLTASRLTSAIPVIADQAEQVVAGWPSPGDVDAERAAVNLISALNIRYLLDEPSEALSALVERELVLARPTRWPLPLGRRRLRHAQRATYDAIGHHVRTRPSPASLQAVLIDHGFDEHTVTLALRTMLLSSHHIPATALAWALHELATHPDVQERARVEIIARPNPTADLPLCRAVIRETLRLHPPVWRLQRQLTATARGLPAGTNLLFSPYLNHHDPDAYPEPSTFQP